MLVKFDLKAQHESLSLLNSPIVCIFPKVARRRLHFAHCAMVFVVCNFYKKQILEHCFTVDIYCLIQRTLHCSQLRETTHNKLLPIVMPSIICYCWIYGTHNLGLKQKNHCTSKNEIIMKTLNIFCKAK